MGTLSGSLQIILPSAIMTILIADLCGIENNVDLLGFGLLPEGEAKQ